MPVAHPSPTRRLCLTRDGIPPLGQVLVRTGRVHLLQLTAAEVDQLDQLDRTSGVTTASRREPGIWWWEPGEPRPTDLPELTDDEALAVSAAELAALAQHTRTLDGADWDDPRARPPDPPG